MTTTAEQSAEEAAVPGWGGRREGAGRPAGSGEDLVDLDTQVRRDQMEWLDRTREAAGERSRAVTVRRLLDQARRVEAVRLALVDAAEHGEQVDVFLDLLEGRDTIAEAEQG